MLVMVDYVRKMTVKKSCKYGEYWSCEHLLFLLLLFALVCKVLNCVQVMVNKCLCVFLNTGICNEKNEDYPQMIGFGFNRSTLHEGNVLCFQQTSWKKALLCFSSFCFLFLFF